MYNDFLAPQDIEHGLFGVFENGASHWATVSMYRSQSLPEFQTSDVELLHFLAPHMQRAFRMHFQFSGLRTRSTELAAALDMVSQGVVFLGPSGQIVRMNRAAHAITARNDGLMATRNGLRAECPSESVQLGKLIQEAITTARDNGLGPAGGLSVSRKNGPSLQVLITPSRNVHVEVEQAVCAIAFVSDPAQKARPTHDTLRTLFGLTPAECRVALLLGDGKSPRQIAQLLAVSSNTVKSQVSAIYAKTGTSRHAELVRLMASLQGSPCL
jgi:DNA-binding CsgD family transcriptional regulator